MLLLKNDAEMLVSLSKYQIRELIRCVEGTDIDTDVVHVLQSFLLDPADVRERPDTLRPAPDSRSPR